MAIFADFILVAATVIAAAIDIRIRRIPNVLTATLAILAIALHVTEGVTAALLAIASMLVAFALGTVVFRLGWFGGGDVKLLAACCGVVSYPNCIALVGLVLAAGAVLALITAASAGELPALIRSTLAVAAGRAPAQTSALPYGVAIAGGCVIYVALALVSPVRFS